jgi:hypothetical protein
MQNYLALFWLQCDGQSLGRDANLSKPGTAPEAAKE